MKVAALLGLFLWLLSVMEAGKTALPQSATPACGANIFACSRHDFEVTQPDAPPIIDFGGLRGSATIFHDPVYNNVEIVRCTDAFSNSVHPNASYSVGLGGAGDKNSWNTDDTLLQVNSAGGIQLLFWFDPKSKNCRPVCADGSESPRCQGSGLYIAKPGVFSRVDPTTYYAFPSANAPGTTVN
ncbi:MAG TPA: hypothetical protein VLL05_05595, partial [Terriglobales bacterium]|nr:hypothetical protein [Terriglobales bacterium]